MAETKYILASDEAGHKIYLVEVPEEATIKAGNLVSVRRTDSRNRLNVKEQLYTALCDGFTIEKHSSACREIRHRTTYTEDEMIVTALYEITRYDEESEDDADDGENTGGGSSDTGGENTGDQTEPGDTGEQTSP